MKNSFKNIFTAAVLCTSAFFVSCEMGIPYPEQDSPFSTVNNIRSLMQRADVEKMMFMGGSALYSPKDSNANQIAKDVIIATRIGKVEKLALGNGNYSYRNSKKEFELGYIAIDSVSKAELSFSYYKFNSASTTASPAGSFSLLEGEKADLNGDGTADIQFRKPDAGRRGYKTNMWLSFLCDVDEGDTATMFSIIPIQYQRSAYPNGLLGINTEGQYVISKYEMGSSNRSVVSNIAYGDYVMDSQSNEIARYVGEQRNGGRSAARVIGDSELKTVEQISADATPENFEYKPQEFAGEFDIVKLLSMLPSSLVTENYSGRTVTENTAYLNRIIRSPSFISEFVAANPGEVAEEINSQLAQGPVSNEVERVIFNRVALSLMYPEDCPAVNLASESLSSVFPWFYIDFGDVLEQSSADESDVSSRSVSKSEMWKTKLEQDYNSKFNSYKEEARKKHSSEVGKKTNDYIESEIQRDAIEIYFSTLTNFNIAPVLAAASGQQWLRDIIKSAKGGLSLGIAGGISFANANPSFDIKLGVLIKAELENSIAITIESTSLFASTAPKTLPVKEAQKRINADLDKKNEQYAKIGREEWQDDEYDEEATKKYLEMLNTIDYPKDAAGNNAPFDALTNIQKGDYTNAIRPTKDSKGFHKVITPIKTIPFAIAFDGQFDILLKVQAVVEANNVTLGFVTMFLIECKAGIDWGFRDYYFGKKYLPKVTTFWAEPYAAANCNREFAGFAGINTIDKTQAVINGGIKATFCPVIEFRAGVGIGYDILGSGSIDITVGGAVDLWAPLTLYMGFGLRWGDWTPLVVREASLDVGIGVHGDVQFCLKPPLMAARRWNYDIPGLKNEAVWQIFKLRMENNDVVKSEGVKTKKEWVW